MAWNTWLIYLLAATGLSLSPGPNSLLALTHGALYGTRRALATLAGGALGFVALIAASMFGIGALLQTSTTWLVVLKWVGGAYLVWLGVQVWRSPPIAAELQAAHDTVLTPGAMFRQGFLAAATNPKGILFFAAFLPQFIEPQHGLWLQFAVMAGTFVVVEFATELALAGMAQHISPWLARVGRRFNQVCGGVFVLIGAWLPLRT